MVILRFENDEQERRALGWLAGRFSFKMWDNGELMVHESVLPYLAREGISLKFRDRRRMSISGRRFEILLPLRFNDGSPMPDALIAETLVELRRRFGAVSSETQKIEGRGNTAGRCTAMS